MHSINEYHLGRLEISCGLSSDSVIHFKAFQNSRKRASMSITRAVDCILLLVAHCRTEESPKFKVHADLHLRKVKKYIFISTAQLVSILFLFLFCRGDSVLLFNREC
ncbi:hypothetical protein BCR42DRAFT_398082 [Absidia repens]|uniref:Uncharacterized protein n=1 Tax=Absidia repens TaxID=90262 RepID=A0A1X2HZ90_9FUNG|nr:hypothetical protein BCR42DRAFT_398082 [Absidia repens]